MNKIYHSILIGVVIFNFITCTNSDTAQKPDAITKSSEDINKEKSKTLPPHDDFYKVFGYATGFKGYIVKYSDNLYRGGNILSDSGAALLGKYDIKTIISVTPSEEQIELANKYNIQYVEFPFDYSEISESKLAHFIDLIKKSKRPLYINCHGGNQRAGCLCAIYRMCIEEWSFERALIEYGKLGGKLKEDFVMLEKCAEKI